MSAKVSITLDQAVLEFVDRSSQNRSQFINEILSREQKRQLLQELEDAYTELANDPEYQAEIKLWDVTVGDGIQQAVCLERYTLEMSAMAKDLLYGVVADANG
jgi:hypothetical protein